MRALARWLLLLAVVIGMFLLGTSASGWPRPPLNLERLLNDSRLIVVGHLAPEIGYIPYDRAWEQHAKLAVKEALKGDKSYEGQNIAIRLRYGLAAFPFRHENKTYNLGERLPHGGGVDRLFRRPYKDPNMITIVDHGSDFSGRPVVYNAREDSLWFLTEAKADSPEVLRAGPRLGVGLPWQIQPLPVCEGIRALLGGKEPGDLLWLLVCGLPHSDPRRVQAQANLQRTPDGVLVEKLFELRADADARVRERVVEVFAGLADKKHLRRLLVGLTDKDPGVRQSAYHVLRHLPTPERASSLARVLEHADPEVRTCAAQAIWMVGHEDIPLVAQALGDSSPRVRHAACVSIPRLAWDVYGDDGAVLKPEVASAMEEKLAPILKHLQKDPDEEVRKAATRVLRYMGKAP